MFLGITLVLLTVTFDWNGRIFATPLIKNTNVEFPNAKADQGPTDNSQAKKLPFNKYEISSSIRKNPILPQARTIRVFELPDSFYDGVSQKANEQNVKDQQLPGQILSKIEGSIDPATKIDNRVPVKTSGADMVYGRPYVNVYSNALNHVGGPYEFVRGPEIAPEFLPYAGPKIFYDKVFSNELQWPVTQQIYETPNFDFINGGISSKHQSVIFPLQNMPVSSSPQFQHLTFYNYGDPQNSQRTQINTMKSLAASTSSSGSMQFCIPPFYSVPDPSGEVTCVYKALPEGRQGDPTISSGRGLCDPPKYLFPDKSGKIVCARIPYKPKPEGSKRDTMRSSADMSFVLGPKEICIPPSYPMPDPSGKLICTYKEMPEGRDDDSIIYSDRGLCDPPKYLFPDKSGKMVCARIPYKPKPAGSESDTMRSSADRSFVSGPTKICIPPFYPVPDASGKVICTYNEMPEGREDHSITSSSRGLCDPPKYLFPDKSGKIVCARIPYKPKPAGSESDTMRSSADRSFVSGPTKICIPPFYPVPDPSGKEICTYKEMPEGREDDSINSSGRGLCAPPKYLFPDKSGKIVCARIPYKPKAAGSESDTMRSSADRSFVSGPTKICTPPFYPVPDSSGKVICTYNEMPEGREDDSITSFGRGFCDPPKYLFPDKSGKIVCARIPYKPKAAGRESDTMRSSADRSFVSGPTKICIPPFYPVPDSSGKVICTYNEMPEGREDDSITSYGRGFCDPPKYLFPDKSGKIVCARIPYKPKPEGSESDTMRSIADRSSDSEPTKICFPPFYPVPDPSGKEICMYKPKPQSRENDPITLFSRVGDSLPGLRSCMPNSTGDNIVCASDSEKMGVDLNAAKILKNSESKADGECETCTPTVRIIGGSPAMSSGLMLNNKIR